MKFRLPFFAFELLAPYADLKRNHYKNHKKGRGIKTGLYPKPASIAKTI